MSYSDLQLAWILLAGEVENLQGKRRKLNEGTPMELEARAAIARLLRSEGPLDRQLRDRLADLFDPDPPGWEQRKIKFKGRRKGGMTDFERNTKIADYIWAEVERGGQVTTAIESAAEKFALSDDSVEKIWARYRPLMEGILGPLRCGGGNW
jgi:hypothetical protein